MLFLQSSTYKSYITFVIHPPLMIAPSWAESTQEITNYGRFINQFPPNIIRSIQQFKRINKKICIQKMSIMFNQIYIYIYTHTHTCEYLCIIFGHQSHSNGVTEAGWW